MSLLRQIQDDAVSGQVDMATVLRRCKLLAARLNSRPLEQWIQWESEGYPPKAAVPKYRSIHTILRGDFFGPFGRQLRNAEIPTACIPKKSLAYFTIWETRESIHAIEEAPASAGASCRVSIPLDVANQAFSGKVYRDMNCLAAWQSVPNVAFLEIVNAVRNKVLDFALSIAGLNPEAGEAEIGKPALRANVVNQVFNTTVYGGEASVVGTANQSVVTVKDVAPSDVASLRDALLAIGIARTDAKQLEAAIKSDPKPRKGGKLGPKVAGWIGSMVSKAASGAWKVATGSAAAMLTRAIRQYYGLPE